MLEIRERNQWKVPSQIKSEIEGNQNSYADLLTKTFAGASTQASPGHPPKVLLEVIRRLPQVPRVFPPQSPAWNLRMETMGTNPCQKLGGMVLRQDPANQRGGYLSSRPSLPLALDSLEERFPGPPNGVGFHSINKLLCFCLSSLGDLTLHSPNPRPYNLASWCMTLNKKLASCF